MPRASDIKNALKTKRNNNLRTSMLKLLPEKPDLQRIRRGKIEKVVALRFKQKAKSRNNFQNRQKYFEHFLNKKGNFN